MALRRLSVRRGLLLAALLCVSVPGGGAARASEAASGETPSSETPSSEASSSEEAPAEAPPYVEPGGAACAQYVTRSMPGITPQAPPRGLPCRQVAVFLLDKMLEQGVPTEAVQPIVDVGGTHGGAGQSSAVPSVLPTPEAGATVSASGTHAGPKLLAEIRVNPLSLAAASTEDKAYYSRVADIRLLLPVSSGAAPSSLQDIKYVGLRVLVNMAGLGVLSEPSGSHVYAASQTALKVQAASSSMLRRLRELLEKSSDVPGCANALLAKNEQAAQAMCGGAISLQEVTLANQEFLKAVGKARIEADSRYWGLDLRGDFGDPTLAGDEHRRGTYLSASMAGGYAIVEGTRYIQPRWRLGATYAYARGVPEEGAVLGPYKAVYALDVAAGLELGTVRQAQRVKANVGLEARLAREDSVGDTRYFLLNVGLTVPTSESSSLSVGISLPLAGSRPALLTLGGDLSLLLSGK